MSSRVAVACVCVAVVATVSRPAAQSGRADRDDFTAIGQALDLMEANCLDVPDWPRILIAALEGLTRAESSIDVLIRPGAKLQLRSHRAGKERLVSLSPRTKTAADVFRELSRAMRFARDNTTLDQHAIAEAFINGLTVLSGAKGTGDAILAASRPGGRPDRPDGREGPAWREIGPEIGYLRIREFLDDTASGIVRILADRRTAAIRGIVLDLRESSTTAPAKVTADIAGLFVEEGTVVARWTGRSPNWNQTHTARAPNPFARMPLVVVVNGRTGGTAESLAGALRDARAVPLVGEKTAGQGIILAGYRLANDVRVVLRVARTVTPKGAAVDGAGLTPDLEVGGLPPSESTTVDPETDPQLAVALAALRVMMGAGS